MTSTANFQACAKRLAAEPGTGAATKNRVLVFAQELGAQAEKLDHQAILDVPPIAAPAVTPTPQQAGQHEQFTGADCAHPK